MSHCNEEFMDETFEPWAPPCSPMDPNKEKTLMEEIKRCVNRIERSQFYHDFKDQLQAPQICERLHMVLGLDSTINVVIYGVGNFEIEENPKYQLSLAILIRRDFNWVGDIEVFDPALSMNECQVLEALGCSVLEFNEDGKRKVMKPTIFFMPHCPITLFDNLLRANWESSLLSNIVILGNSFDTYASYASSELCPSDLMEYILLATTFTNEFGVKTNFKDYYEDSKVLSRNRRGGGAFHGLSWHFFDPF